MNQNNDVFENRWDGFPWKFLNWGKKRHNDHLTKVNSMREHSISILQNRYGYTREEAIYQLDKYYSRAWLG